MGVDQITYEQAFRPRARILQLLGDELIGSPRLAVFELVKNAYDADAEHVSVILDLADPGDPTILVQDDGDGMSIGVIQDIWLVPGNDHRKQQRIKKQRTQKKNRLPLGEKGVGRFAVHKLGEFIRVVTRAAGELECVIEINWNELISKPYLDEAQITITQREPQVFTDGSTGTQIFIGDLRNKEWRRGEVRSLHRQITSICSPFHSPESFAASMYVPGHQEWIEDLLDYKAILNRAPWKYSFEVSATGLISWDYSFRPMIGVNLEPRLINKADVPLLLPKGSDSKKVADPAYLDGIGPLRGEVYVFDRDREILKLMSDVKLLTDYLDDNGGIRIYRDGIRVYNYGEPGVDWLGLDLRRVNKPTKKISNNIVIGVVHLDIEDSTKLLEKTNREGFVENRAYENLKTLILSSLAVFEAERDIDKDRVRKILSASVDPVVANIKRPMEALRSAMQKHGVLDKFETYVSKLEQDYESMQQTLLTAGMSGLNLAVIFHEVERGVRTLHRAIEDGADIKIAAVQARDLTKLLDGFSGLLRRDDQKAHDAKKLITRARDLSLSRLRFHKVKFSSDFLETLEGNFSTVFSFGLILNALVNVIDNALYWMQVRWPESSNLVRELYVGVSHDFELGPAIIVADNGPGFQDHPEDMVRPFFTRRPSGMGLGLYYSNLAMELNGGILAFPSINEVDVPERFDGAIVALIFKDLK